MNACKKKSLEKPVGLKSRRHHAANAAVAGAWLGWLLGLSFGVGSLRSPEFGLVLPRVSFLTALLIDVAATLIGALVGALIGWTIGQNDTRPD